MSPRHYHRKNSTTPSIVENFAANIGCSSWYNISRQYYQQLIKGEALKYVAGSVRFAGHAFLPNSGPIISDDTQDQVGPIISKLMDSGEQALLEVVNLLFFSGAAAQYVVCALTKGAHATETCL